MNTKEKILIAARKEFLAKGYERASLRVIAKDVGVSAANIYNHWKTKEELFAQVTEKVFMLNVENAESHPEIFAMILEKELSEDDELISKLSELDPLVLVGMV